VMVPDKHDDQNEDEQRHTPHDDPHNVAMPGRFRSRTTIRELIVRAER
jgi:hypothetical protein